MYKILIVDDEEVIRKGLCSMIKNSMIEEFEFLEASNGKEAIEIVGKSKPDIIFTDIRMPYVNGLELIEWITKNIEAPPINVILSGYEDFKYAKEAIRYGVREYLLKPIDKQKVIELLTDILKKLRGEIEKKEAELLQNFRNEEGFELLKEKYFNIILGKEAFDKTSLLNKFSEVGIKFTEDNFKILLIDYDDNYGERYNLMSGIERSLLKENINQAISDMKIKYWIFFDHDMRLVVLLSSHDYLMMDLQIGKVYKQIKGFFKEFKTFAGAGDSVRGIEEIEKSYNQALNCILYKLVKEHGQIIESKNINNDGLKYKKLYSGFSKITEKTELGEKIEINSILEELFKEFDTPDVSAIGIKITYDDLNRYVYDYFTHKNINFSQIFEENEGYFKPYEDFWTLKELRQYIRVYLYKICDVICEYKKLRQNKKIVDKIIVYLWENFNEDINLNSISDTFGKNNSYLSVLFKQETGKNFSEYLTDIRLEKAKEMLAKGNNNIQEVSEAVGYHNSKHFCKVFKKSIGIPPKKYRKECL